MSGGVLRGLRTELRDALEEAGVPAVDREPGRLTPPVALISPSFPYLADANQFGRREVRYRVRLVVPASDGALSDLDDLLELAVPALEGAAGDDDAVHAGDGWNVLEAGEPFTLIAGSLSLPALDITVSTTIYL